MSFVLDASVAAAWVMPDEQNVVGKAAQTSIEEGEAIVPHVWWFEVRNMLVINERRGRLDEAKTAEILSWLRKMPLTIDDGIDEAALLSMSRRHKLTVYDAAYLELAHRRQLPLATLDQALASAARTENIALIGRGEKRIDC